MTTDIVKNMCLIEELEASQELITSGFGELQEIDMANDSYHLPQQLLASGFERMMKCYICLVYEARNGSYPNTDFIKKLSHDLQKIKQTIIDHYFSTNGLPLLDNDYQFIKNDIILNQIVSVLSEFGKKARYYNLDIVTGSDQLPIDPKAEWETIEKQLEDVAPYLASGDTEALVRDYYPSVNSKIIAKLERFTRAIAMQFTLGKHGGQLQQFSPILTYFRNLQDSQFGQTDYRRSAKREQSKRDKWNKRTKSEVLSSGHPSKLIHKDNFSGEWPFRADEAVIERRDVFFCVANIQGYDFALNGAAASRYNFPDPHSAGVAIIGKSIGPFIDMARNLSENS